MEVRLERETLESLYPRIEKEKANASEWGNAGNERIRFYGDH
jgi:hypothetical protein